MEFDQTGHRREERPDLPVNSLMFLHALRLECEKSTVLTASSHRSCFSWSSQHSTDEAAVSESVPTVSRTLCPSMAHSSSDGYVGCTVWPQIAGFRKNLGMPSQYFVCPEVAISQRTHLEKAKALPISLAKVPTLHRIAVGRNLESWWRYEGGPML